MDKETLLNKLQDKMNYRDNLQNELVAVAGQIVMLRDLIKEMEVKPQESKKKVNAKTK